MAQAIKAEKVAMLKELFHALQEVPFTSVLVVSEALHLMGICLILKQQDIMVEAMHNVVVAELLTLQPQREEF